MISLSFDVPNIATVIQVYNQIEVVRYNTTTINPPAAPVGSPISLVDWTVVSGTIGFNVPIQLSPDQNYYLAYDPDGEATDWYSSRYSDSDSGSVSAWSDPVLGGDNDLLYDPTYEVESDYTDEELAIIDRLRVYIGDPIGLVREYGEDALGSIHPDGKTYELREKGWPVYITMGGKAFVNKFNPTVNGYKYLKFHELIDTTCISCQTVQDLCGDEALRSIENGVDIWYNNFRHSNKQLLKIYDGCFPPAGLTTVNTTTQAYILQTAIDILSKELIEDATEDGSYIKDEGSVYNPEAGLKIRKALLDDLRKQLKDLVNSLMLKGISGVLID